MTAVPGLQASITADSNSNSDSDSERRDTRNVSYDSRLRQGTTDAKPAVTVRTEYGHDLNNGLRRTSGESL